MSSESQQGSSSVIESAKGKAKEIFSFSPSPRLGDFAVIGRWILIRDNGLHSLFDLHAGGKGTETMYLDKVVQMSCEWKMEGEELVVLTQGDKQYVHRFRSPILFGYAGEVTCEGRKDSEFEAYPYR